MVANDNDMRNMVAYKRAGCLEDWYIMVDAEEIVMLSKTS